MPSSIQLIGQVNMRSVFVENGAGNGASARPGRHDSPPNSTLWLSFMPRLPQHLERIETPFMAPTVENRQQVGEIGLI